MGNFHCIPSECARIVWREYLPPVVRWRYEEENWNEIEADSFTTRQQTGQCLDKRYLITGYAEFMPRPKFGLGCNLPMRYKLGKTVLGVIKSITLSKPVNTDALSNSPITALVTRVDRDGIEYSYSDYLYGHTGYLAGNRNPLKYVEGECRNSLTQNAVTNVGDWEAETVDGSVDNCSDCTFSIIKNGEIVHTETRDSCPEIEQLPCRLSNISQEIEIEKLSYLERIEVRNQDINLIYVSPLEAPLVDVSPLPDNCLNIYKTLTPAPPILSNYVPLPGVINPFQYIWQICSVNGCPPPEYEVICDCNNCESCPSGTCAVKCNGYICCHDRITGKAVKEIAIADYCEENL